MGIESILNNIGNIDIMGLSGILLDKVIKNYKDSKTKKEAEIVNFVSMALIISLENKYEGYTIYTNDIRNKNIYEDVTQILEQLKIDNIFMMLNENIIHDFILKFQETNVISIKSTNEFIALDIDKFYSLFEIKFREVVLDLGKKNEIAYKDMMIYINGHMNEKLDYILKMLQDIYWKYEGKAMVNESNKSKVIVRSLGDFSQDSGNYELDFNFMDYFEKRSLKANFKWEDIKNQIEQYSKGLKNDLSYVIEAQAHLSIGFYLGACINSKSHKDVTIIQKSGKNSEWYVDENINSEEYEAFEESEELLNNQGEDIIVCISITQPIDNVVKEYIDRKNINAKKIINFKFPNNNCNNNIVKDGNHCWKLATSVKNRVNLEQSKSYRGKLHIFATAPFGLMFMLGQLSFAFRNVQLYEYIGGDAVYSPSIFAKTLDLL